MAVSIYLIPKIAQADRTGMPPWAKERHKEGSCCQLVAVADGHSNITSLLSVPDEKGAILLVAAELLPVAHGY